MDCIKIGRRMKQAREAANITQERLATLLGCTPQHISAIERGFKQPRLETFVRIANLLGVSSDYLLQDVLEIPVHPLSGEIALILDRLSAHDRARCLCALRAFSQDSDRA